MPLSSSTRIRALVAHLIPVLLVAAWPAAAQSSRQDEIAQQQAEKAGNLHPYQRNVFERELLEMEQAGGFGVPRGFFVTFGDIKSGSGIAAGPLYARMFDGGAMYQVKGAYSLRNFKMAQVFVQSPALAYGKVQFNGRVRWQDAPELAVYPLGPSSPKSRSDYAETKSEVSAQALLRPVRMLRIGIGTGFDTRLLGSFAWLVLAGGVVQERGPAHSSPPPHHDCR